jgi:hypothetical protein
MGVASSSDFIHASSRLLLVWGLFFLVSFSLGYPTLNRYAPTTAAVSAENSYGGMPDTRYYASLVKNGFAKTPDSHWRYRVLVPYVAKPFYLLSKGNIGSWSPVFFGLLMANSLFVASAAVILFLIGSSVTGSRAVGFISSLLLLSNFNISNLYLAGLVDSSELFLMILTTWLLLQKKWRMLPFIAIVAFLARETAVIFTVGLSSGWLLVDAIRGRIRRPEIYSILFYILAATALGLGGLVLLRYAGTSKFVPPWRFEGNIDSFSLASIRAGIWGLATSKALVYSFIWLLPLGLLGIRSIPRNWLWASVLTTGMALFLVVMMNAGENAGRPLFTTAGPMLLVAAASYITKFLGLERP